MPDGETRLPGPHADPVPLMLNAKLLVESLNQVTDADTLAAVQANTTLEPRRNRRRFLICQIWTDPFTTLKLFSSGRETAQPHKSKPNTTGTNTPISQFIDPCFPTTKLQ